MAKKAMKLPNKHANMPRYNPPKVTGNGVAQGATGSYPKFLDESKTSGRYKTPKW